MSEDVQREFFEKLARRYDSRFCRSRWPRNQVAKALLIAEALGDRVGEGPVVEIGCGTGQVAAELLKRFPGMRYVGFDLSPGMLSVAKKRLEEFGVRVELSIAKSGDLPTSPDGYAAAFGIDVLHHVEDPPTLLEQLRSSLRAASPVVFLEANPIFPITALMGVFQREERGVFRIRPANLRGWYAQAGFVNATVTLGPIYTPPGPKSIERRLDSVDRLLAKTPAVRNLALFYNARAQVPARDVA
jgi:SAM-dependent methyltransferase